MKIAKRLKKCGVLFLLLFMLSTVTYSVVPAMTVSASDVMPMSDDIRQVLKKINGKWYKRLYNFTTQQWIGDWIPF